jgi:hypothetical protein
MNKLNFISCQELFSKLSSHSASLLYWGKNIIYFLLPESQEEIQNSFCFKPPCQRTSGASTFSFGKSQAQISLF